MTTIIAGDPTTITRLAIMAMINMRHIPLRNFPMAGMIVTAGMTLTVVMIDQVDITTIITATPLMTVMGFGIATIIADPSVKFSQFYIDR